ncbi:MAG: hypothetical protein V4592_18025 [Bacteroidota bacterium]
MKLRKLILGSAFVLALTASVAFKSARKGPINSTYPNQFEQCNYDVVDDDCAIPNTGARCMGLSTGLPQFDYWTGLQCHYPLYHEF